MPCSCTSARRCSGCTGYKWPVFSLVRWDLLLCHTAWVLRQAWWVYHVTKWPVKRSQQLQIILFDKALISKVAERVAFLHEGSWTRQRRHVLSAAALPGSMVRVVDRRGSRYRAMLSVGARVQRRSVCRRRQCGGQCLGQAWWAMQQGTCLSSHGGWRSFQWASDRLGTF